MEIETGPNLAERILRQHRVSHTLGKTWTTDGIYRETRAKIRRGRDEGCLTVEMEAAASFAVSQFRGIRFSQILYAADDVSSDTWVERESDHAEARLRVLS